MPPEEILMAITIACRCGRKFTAKDEQVGKRFPCPQCGATLEVRASAGAGAPARPPEPGGRGGALKS
jgi:hypothetical protein